MKLKDAVVPLASLALLVGTCLLIRDYGIRQQIEAKTAFYVQAGSRFTEVLDRMNRLSESGTDLAPFHEIAETELRNLMRLDRERRELSEELWLFSGRP
jgi:hypothetical protein